MARFSSEQIRKKLEGIGVRQVRLVCGVILFAYLVSHFLNHALGNISMNALAEGVYYHTRVLAVPARCDRALHRHAGAFRARHLGDVPAPAVQLEDGRAAAARAGPEHPRADRRAYRRRAAGADDVRTSEALSAGALRLLGRLLPGKDPGDVGGARHRLGAWLHRPAFLAAHEAVLQAPCAVPARGRRAGPDAGAARLLPGRPDGDRGCRRSGLADQESGPAAGRNGGRAKHARYHHRRFPDRISRSARPRRAGARRARAP